VNLADPVGGLGPYNDRPPKPGGWLRGLPWWGEPP
jgi:hypothetical protein